MILVNHYATWPLDLAVFADLVCSHGDTRVVPYESSVEKIAIWPRRAPGLVQTAAQDGPDKRAHKSLREHPQTPNPNIPWRTYIRACTLLQHPTSPAPPPTPLNKDSWEKKRTIGRPKFI